MEAFLTTRKSSVGPSSGTAVKSENSFERKIPSAGKRNQIHEDTMIPKFIFDAAVGNPSCQTLKKAGGAYAYSFFSVLCKK